MKSTRKWLLGKFPAFISWLELNLSYWLFRLLCPQNRFIFAAIGRGKIEVVREEILSNYIPRRKRKRARRAAIWVHFH